jgi:hypothetical protein
MGRFARRLWVRLLAALALAWPLAAAAQFVDPGLRWRTFDTEHFSVHFPDQYRAQADAAAQVAEGVYPRVTGWLQWRPETRVHLLVLDSADFSNGWATPFPFNEFAIYLSPPDEGELLQNRGWMEMVISHEFTHIVHMDKARRGPLLLRNIFGRAPPLLLPLVFPNTLPNLWGPAWVKEGLAVYSESEASGGYGRLGQSFFEGMMRAEVARGLRSLREIHADGRGFPLNRDYLYGSYFFMFLGERYGEQAVAGLIEDYSNDIIPFRVHSSTAGVTGKPMDVLWVEYLDWLDARFRAKEPPRPDGAGDALVQTFSVSSPVIAPDGTRWYVRHDGYTLPKLVEQAAGGEPRVVREVESGTRVSVTAAGEPLLAQPEICGNYNYFYDLWRGGTGFLGGYERLTRCARFRFTAPLEDGRIVALRIAGGEGQVVVLGANGGEERMLYRATPGEMITGVAARGTSVVLTSWRAGRWALVEVGDGRAVELVADSAVKHSPRFGDSADEIFFVADYGRVYNVWSYARPSRRLARWTQAPYGVQDTSAPVGGEILLTTIEADGDALRIYRLPQAPLERRDAVVGPVVAAAAPPAPPASPVADRQYWPLSSMLPRWWLPQVIAADGMVAFGAQTGGIDALGLHEYAIAPLWETSEREFLGNAWYVYDGRHGVFLDRSMTVKANDPNSDKNSFRRRITEYEIDETAQWVSTWRYVTLGARWYAGLGAALDREVLHDIDVATTRPRDERVTALVAGVDTRRWQWYGEGPTQGQQLRLFAETSNHLKGQFQGNVYRSDWRVFYPIGHTVLSARWNEVYAQPEAETIELGGTLPGGYAEETYGYSLPVLNQRQFALRGYDAGVPGLIGHRARLGTLEWRTPLADIDRATMLPPVGINRVSMNVFVDAGAAWDSGQQRQYRRGVGVELMTEARAGYLFGAQFRLGVARGIDDFGRTVGYFRIGRSF